MVKKNGKPVLLAPLFADTGMVFFTGSGGSDYLDFIGDISNPGILEGMLLQAAVIAMKHGKEVYFPGLRIMGHRFVLTPLSAKELADMLESAWARIKAVGAAA